MDAKKDSKIVKCDIMAEKRRNTLVVGAKQIRKGLKAGRILRVYLAQNADPAITRPIMAACEKERIECIWVKSMTDLGSACGIEVGAATAAVVK